MILAHELIIGAYVGVNLDRDPENFFTIEEVARINMKIREGCSNKFGDTSYICEDDVNGIPLTDEWFKRLNFDPKSFNRLLDEVKINIKFVHQLQLLYLATTGKQLK